MKKNVYLIAALIGMGGFVWNGCSDDEKIVEVEKIVEIEKIVPEQDITKLSEAARAGLKGNPKTVTESYSYSATEDETTKEVKPGRWEKKTVTDYNNAGYATKTEEYSAYYINAVTDPAYPDEFMLKDKELKLNGTTTYSLNSDNKYTGIQKETKTLSVWVVTTKGESMLVPEMYWSGWISLSYDFGLEEDTYSRIELKTTLTTKSVTTFEGGKAIRITQAQEEGKTTWEDIQKEILDLDEFGYPNESSKESFDAARSYSMKTRAFEQKPSARYVEVLDSKGNWIIRYELSSSSSYIKRDIVYY